jgi:hypothetical protein
VRLYLSKNNNRLNGKDLLTETITPHLCLNPRYKVSLSQPSSVLLDSGGFQDRQANTRVTFNEALMRQLAYEAKVGFVSQRLVAYDLIGDTDVTVDANRYLHDLRWLLAPRQLVLMLQGETVADYRACLEKTLEFAQPGDCIGFGGMALAGRHKNVREKLYAVLRECAPIIAAAGIRDVHFFGIGSFSVLREISKITRVVSSIFGPLDVSSDTSAYEVMSTMGNVVNLTLEKWEKVYDKAQKYIDYHPADLTQANMRKALVIVSQF